ncbi:MAG: hypothetical protein IJF83_06075 [Methanobrevibacter sp.]|nr:hypothetical protein [Methanobrevibacter sp.]
MDNFYIFNGHKELTRDYATIGDKSIHFYNDPSSHISIGVTYLDVTEDQIGKSFEFKAKVYNPNTVLTQMIIAISSGNIRNIVIPKTTDFIEVSSTVITVPETTYLRCIFNVRQSDSLSNLYVDDIRLTIQ